MCSSDLKCRWCVLSLFSPCFPPSLSLFLPFLLFSFFVCFAKEETPKLSYWQQLKCQLHLDSSTDCFVSSHMTIVKLLCITLSKSFGCQHCLGFFYCSQLYTVEGPGKSQGRKKMLCNKSVPSYYQLYEKMVRKQMYIISSKNMY